MPRLRRVAGLCSSNVSDTANMLRKIRKKKSSAVPLFRSGHMSAICARLSKGKGRFTRGWKPQVSTLLCPRRVGALPAEVQRKPPRPSGTNTPAAVRAPRSAGAEKTCRPDRVNRLRGSSPPVSRCRETDSRPAGTYESLRLNSSYPNIRTTSSVPSARRMAISGSGMPLNVLVLTMV